MDKLHSELVRLDDIPPIMPPARILDKAFKRAGKAKRRGRTRIEKSKSESIAKIQVLGDVISSTLEKYVKSFPSIDRLPIFYRDLIDILVNTESLKKDLGALSWGQRKVIDFSKAYVREIGRQNEISLIELRRKEAYGRISSVLEQIGKNLKRLEEARIRLKEVPTIDPNIKTIVVAGMANVGKSLFVAAASSAKPKVAHYPFTTKKVSVGHVELHRTRFQIIDTPGLLDRPAEKRNKIEQQAVNALRHLSKVVIYLLDPTESCGFDLSSQTNLLKRLKEELPDVTFVEVENKVDILDSNSAREKVSALTGQGVHEVIEEAAFALTNHAPEAFLHRKEH